MLNGQGWLVTLQDACVPLLKQSVRVNNVVTTDIENTLGVSKRERCWGGMNWEFGLSRCKLIYVE